MAFSQAELDALKEAYASGVLEVTYDGKTTRYDSGAALLARIKVITTEIDATASPNGARPKVGFVTMRRN